MLQYIVFAVIIFLLLLVAIPIGAAIYLKSKSLSILISIAAGVGVFFLTIKILKYFELITEYNWIYLVISSVVIGAMNNANLKKETTEESRSASTFLFGAFVITSIIYLFI